MSENIKSNFDNNFFKVEFPNNFNVLVLHINREFEVHVSQKHGLRPLSPIEYLDENEAKILVEAIANFDIETEPIQAATMMLELLERVNTLE